MIVGNIFGVTAAGTRETYVGHYTSIMIDGSPNNVVGTPALADRNVVTGGFDGIVVDNPGADGNVFQNNIIGASPDGRQPWGGQCTGIDFNVGPKNNVVGGTGKRERNVITAYGCDGVEFSHGFDQATGDTSVMWQVNDNTVVGNYIGIRSDGSYDPAFTVGLNHNENDSSAVNIWDIANHNTVTGNYLTAAWNAVRIAHELQPQHRVRQQHRDPAERRPGAARRRTACWCRRTRRTSRSCATASGTSPSPASRCRTPTTTS